MKQKSKGMTKIFIWILAILFLSEIITMLVLSDWESDIRSIKPKLYIESAQWISSQNSESSEFGEIIVSIKNVGTKPRRPVPNLLFMNSNEQDASGETLIPDGYYKELSSQGAVDYSSSEIIPPGVTVTVRYPLTEQDLRELNSMIMAQKKVYVRLSELTSDKKIYYELQMQKEEE